MNWSGPKLLLNYIFKPLSHSPARGYLFSILGFAAMPIFIRYAQSLALALFIVAYRLTLLRLVNVVSMFMIA